MEKTGSKTDQIQTAENIKDSKNLENLTQIDETGRNTVIGKVLSFVEGAGGVKANAGWFSSSY